MLAHALMRSMGRMLCRRTAKGIGERGLAQDGRNLLEGRDELDPVLGAYRDGASFTGVPGRTRREARWPRNHWRSSSGSAMCLGRRNRATCTGGTWPTTASPR
ncbi:MAG: hypothetical protein KGJ23_03585 [Euryarchaeota archaeon]|nr:hypothetical protein [Euryarchaeota archaeon]MDE2043872.1 hypothetical protein [Thermoplasmata archaeon]